MTEEFIHNFECNGNSYEIAAKFQELDPPRCEFVVLRKEAGQEHPLDFSIVIDKWPYEFGVADQSEFLEHQFQLIENAIRRTQKTSTAGK